MERPSTSKARGICKFYESPRGCFAGKNCKFLHGEDEKLTPYDKNKTCRYYRAGYCKRGDACWFLHVDGSEEPSPPGSDAECIICYDKPVTYGLMDGCSHVLCVECIRQWRHPNNRNDDAETTNISCPYCRVASYFVTPSSQFFPKDHPRRAEIVAQYKASMARVPCRHFQDSPPNRRHCPFGGNCFYQHLNADGTPYIFPENPNSRRWIRARDLDDLSASLERLRRSIPEVFGNDAPQAEQQRRLVDLALDVGRTLTRFNFPQTEVFNPLGILLAQHLSQLDAQRNGAEGTENDDGGDDQLRPEVTDAILAAPATTLARDSSGPQFAGDGDQGGESSTTGDGIVVRNPRSIDRTTFPNGIPIDSIRVDFTTGNLRFTTESMLDLAFLDEDFGGAPEEQSSAIDATNAAAEDQAEAGTLNLPDRVPEADSPPRTEGSQPESSEGSTEMSGDVTPGRSPTPVYHDPHPPFETDGRGRVVWSNSSEQARLRSASSPPAVHPRKSSNEETNVTSEKENCGANGPGIFTGNEGNADADADANGSGQGTVVEGVTTEVPWHVAL